MPAAVWKGYTGLVETSKSGGYMVSDTVKRRGIWRGTFTDCVAALPAKGQLGSGNFAGWVVESADLDPDKGNQATLVVVYTAGSGSGAELPEDTWRCPSFDDNPRLERNPRYASLDETAMQNVQTAVQGKDATTRSTAYAALDATGQELVTKMRRGQESYYRPGRRYEWVQHSFFRPVAVDGGNIEVPFGPGAIGLNPTYSWLRMADDLEYDNGIYKLKRTWIGAPAGHWDPDIYQ